MTRSEQCVLVADLGWSQAPAPDDCLLQFYALEAEAVRAVLHRQAAALVNPPISPLEVVAALRRDVLGFVSLLKQDLRT